MGQQRPDFLDAYERHWEDAELLHREGRLANADQLYGLAAECALKRLIIALRSDSSLPRAYHRHVDELWDLYQAHLQGTNAARYAIPPANPFRDWSVEQRYQARSGFNEARVRPHRDAARQVGALVQRAQQEGIIP